MMKNLFLSLAGVAMLVGCQNCGCRSCGNAGGPAQGVGQVPATPTSSLAGKSMQGPTSGQALGAQPIMPQQTTPQGGMMMPNAMTAKPLGSDSMSR